MCNAEFMVFSAIAQKTALESAKAAEREAARVTAGLAHSAEDVRRSHEEQAVLEWSDEEMRKITLALGASAVVSAAAGVQIEAITQQWAAAQVELYGARSALRRKQAVAGDFREADFENVKSQRLIKSKRAEAWEWAVDIGNAFVQGVYMEKKIFGTANKTFGIDTSEWFKSGEKEMPVLSTDDAGDTVDPVDPVRRLTDCGEGSLEKRLRLTDPVGLGECVYSGKRGE